jgi:chemotaxis protein histidine kinase CheA
VTDTDVQREIQILRAAYCRKLPAELARLATLLVAAREAGDEQQLDAAHRLAHMLKGSSGSYGLADVSAELKRIEEHLDRALEGESPVTEGVWDEIEDALRTARDWAARPGSWRHRLRAPKA